MDKQTRDARQMAKELPLGEKIKHFFEYYKWYVIVPLVLILAIGGTIYQSLTKEKYDVDISHYGEFSITEEQKAKIDEYFSQYIQDIDNDGRLETNILSTISLSKDPEYQMGVATKFMAELSAGTYTCYLFSEEFYNTALSYEIDFERVINTKENKVLSEIFQNSNMYFCVRKLYERELKDEQKVMAQNNAVLLLDGIIQE